MSPANDLSVALFLCVVASVLVALHAGVYFAARRLGQPARRRVLQVAAGVSLWLVAFSLFVKSGLLLERPLPFLPILLVTTNVVSVAFALSPVGRSLAKGLPLAALVLFQGFRLPLELILHSWAQQGTIPYSMTWEGQNLDILSGIAALVAFPFVRKKPGLAWVANVVGLVLLLNVMRVAVMSSPLPFAWGVEPPLWLAAWMPYALIVPVCVGGALAGHIVLTRALLGRSRA